MQRIISTIYAIISAAAAGYCTVFLYQPSMFFADIFTTDGGTKYYIAPVFLLTWLLFLVPLILFVLAARLTRKNDDGPVAPGRTGIFITRKTALESAMLAVPVFINGYKVTTVDNGKTRFIDLRPGTVTIHTGKGKQESEKKVVEINEGQQLRFETKAVSEGLILKYHLWQII